MESISNAELIELFFIASDFIETQFQYWLSISFAAIVATSIAGERMTVTIRSTLIVLYVMATALFLLRYISALDEFSLIANEASARGVIGEDGRALALPALLLRSALFLAGTFATVWFLYRRGKGILEPES